MSIRRNDLFSQLDGLEGEFNIHENPKPKRKSSKVKTKTKTKTKSKSNTITSEVQREPSIKSNSTVSPRVSGSSYIDDIWDFPSDNESVAESTHTGETSIYFDSPPRKTSNLAKNLTSSHSSPSSPKISHNQFQNNLRIASSTIHNLNDMIDCIEAIVLSESDLIQDHLESFIKTIQESPANNTFKINLFQSKLYSKPPYSITK